MNLTLSKTKEELEHIFKISHVGKGWEKEENNKIYQAGDRYPLITNERPVTMQSFFWGFPLYLDDSRTMLQLITQVGVEGVFDKPLFECISSKRCLVPLQLDNDEEVKYGAGIWETFADKAGVNQRYFTMLTQKVNAGKQRKLFLFENGAHRIWLNEDSKSKAELLKLFL